MDPPDFCASERRLADKDSATTGHQTINQR
jgi:hypothetical protein